MNFRCCIGLLLIGWASATSEPLKPPCPPNESYTGCDIPCSELAKPFQTACLPIISDKCACRQGFYRSKDGPCVPKEQCPETQCPPGSKWTSRCIVDCQKGPACDGAPCFNWRKPCKPGCVCDKGLKLHPDGRCVKPEECPPLPTCPSNSTYNPCWGCTEEECGGRPVACAFGCVNEGCTCLGGFLRNGDGKCVKKEDCPKVRCGSGEVYKTCGSKCSEPKCGVSTDQPVACPAVCEQGCFCRKGYARNRSGTCVNAMLLSCRGS